MNIVRPSLLLITLLPFAAYPSALADRKATGRPPRMLFNSDCGEHVFLQVQISDEREKTL